MKELNDVTFAVVRRTNADAGVIKVQERRRSNASGLHGVRARGNRRMIEAAAIEESFAAWGDDSAE